MWCVGIDRGRASQPGKGERCVCVCVCVSLCVSVCVSVCVCWGGGCVGVCVLCGRCEGPGSTNSSLSGLTTKVRLLGGAGEEPGGALGSPILLFPSPAFGATQGTPVVKSKDL